MVSTLSLNFLPLSDFESGGDNSTIQLLDLHCQNYHSWTGFISKYFRIAEQSM